MVHHPELNSNNDISNITLSGISNLSMHFKLYLLQQIRALLSATL